MMHKRTLSATAISCVGLLLSGLQGSLRAHVPYIEGTDYDEGPDFLIENISQSKAFYAYLDEDDVDSFSMVVEEAERIYVKTLIPFCREYAFYDVSFALIGPDLPPPSAELPVPVPENHGAVVHRAHYKDWADRPYMYEMFSDRRYFEGRAFTHRATVAGTYRFIVWHEHGMPGDYIAIIGRAEEFGPRDMWLAATNTPVIQRKGEMKSSCDDEGNFALWFNDKNRPAYMNDRLGAEP
jgi:hypothetical protein